MTVAHPNGYRMVIPPGWVRIPLRDGTDDALEDLVYSRLRDLPPDVPKDDGMKYRLMVRRSVARQVSEAREAGGLDLYLPLTARYGIPLMASFLVSVHRADRAAIAPPVLLARLSDDGLSDDGTRTSTEELAGTTAVRREHVRQAEPERDLPVPTRLVEYALPVPRDPGRFVSVVFSTAGDGDVDSSFTQAVTELFDASMLTFRWTRDDVDLLLGHS